ncbi:MAG: PfkB family carbohydrate kinase [Dietzia psychralcaliphila]
MTDISSMTIATVGVHVLDVHAIGIDSIPEGSAGALVDTIAFSPAGTAGGTAVVLSRLGAGVRSIGAVGADSIGRTLTTLLSGEGVDTGRLVTKADAQTSASVIPVRPNGDRPAWHCIGANGVFTLDDIDDGALDGLTHLHLGGPEFLGGPAAGELLARARAKGVTTSVDILADGDPGMLEWIADALPHVDYLLPNDDQVRGFTGVDSLAEGARALIDLGVSCVALTAGAAGALVVTADEALSVPAFSIDVVDTTGCGDSFTAGFLVGRHLGHDLRGSAVLGCAVAAQVAQGLGTTAGSYDLDSVVEFARSAPTG